MDATFLRTDRFELRPVKTDYLPAMLHPWHTSSMNFDEAPSLALAFANHRQSNRTITMAFDSAMAEKEEAYLRSSFAHEKGGSKDEKGDKGALFEHYMDKSCGFRRPFTSNYSPGCCNGNYGGPSSALAP